MTFVLSSDSAGNRLSDFDALRDLLEQTYLFLKVFKASTFFFQQKGRGDFFLRNFPTNGCSIPEDRSWSIKASTKTYPGKLCLPHRRGIFCKDAEDEASLTGGKVGDDGISQRMMDALTPNSGFVSSFKRCFFLI